MNRETWLETLLVELKPLIRRAGYELPEVKLSCGWPSTRALSAKRRRLGECWSATACKDNTSQIFISPVLEEPIAVAETLVHEAGHAALGPGVGHKAPFREFMKKVGLTGKPTATYAGEPLKEELALLLRGLGEYPNSALDKLTSPSKKQTTRMRKLSCSGTVEAHEAYILRGAKKTLELGLPGCPVCGREMVVEEPEEEGEGE